MRVEFHWLLPHSFLVGIGLLRSEDGDKALEFAFGIFSFLLIFDE